MVVYRRLGVIVPCVRSRARLSPNPHVMPVPVPDHYEFSGPARRLFYCPDIDGWNG
jgi:hypothetical protein